LVNTQHEVTPSGIPHLVDPDFEAFTLARDPLTGWYSDNANGSNVANMTMTPDSQIKVQGQFSFARRGDSTARRRAIAGISRTGGPIAEERRINA